MSPPDLVGRGWRTERPRPAEPPPPRSPLFPSPPPPATGRPAGSGFHGRRTTVLLAVLGLAPLLAVALLATLLGGAAITDQVNARITGASREAAGYLGQVVAGRVAALQSAADDLDILALAEGSPSASQSAVTSALDGVARAEASSQGIALADAGGTVLLRVGPDNPLAGLSPGWTSRIYRGGFLVEAVPGSLAAPAVTVAVPVLEGGGTAGGFLVERYSLAGAAAPVQDFAGAQGTSLLVLDQAGRAILGVEPSSSGGGATPITASTTGPSITSQVDAALRTGRSLVDDGGSNGPAAYTPVSQAPWVVRAALPGSAMAAVSELKIVVGSVAGALAVLFLAALGLVDRSLRRQEQVEAELVLQTAAMEHAAMHDPLTALPNRLLFNDRLQHGISNARRTERSMALFVLDVDGFKALNDALGHAAGDTVLKETAARLQASVRASDTVARLGGDEFVIVAVDADPRDAELIRAKIRQRMEEPIAVEGGLVSVGLSIGSAAYPEDGTESAVLLRHADTNMYRDKRARKSGAG